MTDDELARVKRIGKETGLNDDDMATLRRAFKELTEDCSFLGSEVDKLRAQNAELLAALRETTQMLEALAALSPEATMTTPFGKDRAALLVKTRAVIAKATP